LTVGNAAVGNAGSVGSHRILLVYAFLATRSAVSTLNTVRILTDHTCKGGGTHTILIRLTDSTLEITFAIEAVYIVALTAHAAIKG
jgi:hypothetical protein